MVFLSLIKTLMKPQCMSLLHSCPICSGNSFGSLHLIASVSVCLSFSVFLFLSLFLSLYLYFYVSLFLSVVYVSICISLYLSRFLAILSLYLSVPLSTFLPPSLVHSHCRLLYTFRNIHPTDCVPLFRVKSQVVPPLI